MYKLSKTNWAKLIYFSLVLREREENPPNISHPSSKFSKSICHWFKQFCYVNIYSDQYWDWPCIPSSPENTLGYQKNTPNPSKVRNIFFLLSFPQKEKKIYQFCSVSFAQFVYFLREVCLLFIFWMIKSKSKHTSLIKYTNLAKLIYFSLVLREREEKKNQIFRT